MTSYHTAHEPYLRAVAQDLTANGVPVTDVIANPDDPRNGAIELGLPQDAPITVAWDEEHGWWRGTTCPDGSLIHPYESPLDLLATPAEVLAWVRSVLDGTATDDPLLGSGGYFRFFDDSDDFEQRLRHYSEQDGHQ